MILTSGPWRVTTDGHLDATGVTPLVVVDFQPTPTVQVRILLTRAEASKLVAEVRSVL